MCLARCSFSGLGIEIPREEMNIQKTEWWGSMRSGIEAGYRERETGNSASACHSEAAPFAAEESLRTLMLSPLTINQAWHAGGSDSSLRLSQKPGEAPLGMTNVPLFPVTCSLQPTDNIQQFTCIEVWEGISIPALTSPKPGTSPKAGARKSSASAGVNEAEAIQRAKEGDGIAFESLYGLHKRRVYSLCLRMTGNTAEAEDLTQEAFLQLYRKIGTFRGESAFSTWLHRLSVNVVLMHLRKKGLPEVSLEETLEPQQEDGPKKDIGARDNVLAGSIDRVNLERAIENLPPGYRIIFVLHDIEGYEHNEIAEMMGCSIGNSKSQLHKARMKLRDLLKQSKAEKAARR